MRVLANSIRRINSINWSQEALTTMCNLLLHTCTPLTFLWRCWYILKFVQRCDAMYAKHLHKQFKTSRHWGWEFFYYVIFSGFARRNGRCNRFGSWNWSEQTRQLTIALHHSTLIVLFRISVSRRSALLSRRFDKDSWIRARAHDVRRSMFFLRLNP